MFSVPCSEQKVKNTYGLCVCICVSKFSPFDIMILPYACTYIWIPIFEFGYRFLNLDTKFEMLVSIMDTSKKFQSRTLVSSKFSSMCGG